MFLPIYINIISQIQTLLNQQQGRQDSNLQPTVLETATLPIELRPYFKINFQLPIFNFQSNYLII